MYNMRNFQDTTVNSEGRKLLKLCEELGISIVNGSVNGDLQGKVSFVRGSQENCASVLDFVLSVGIEGIQKVNKLTVEERIESNHFPVTLELIGKHGNKGHSTVDNGGGEKKSKKLNWQPVNGEQFQEHLTEAWDSQDGHEEVVT